MDAQTLTEAQLRGFSITERTCSVFSLLGSVFVIATFCTSKSFHKPINRLVFYASFGNMMTNVATLMARSYINSPLSAGCQFQGFLIQMFMPADAFWTLAMAVNVYLTFYRKFDARKLRRMEIPYLICCYGVPFVVALAYVFINDSRRGRVYGNATLWCWVSSSWDAWRIATFYGPVWVVILVTFFIYIRTGGEIYKKHRQLRDFRYSSSNNRDPDPDPDPNPNSTFNNQVMITTEIVSDLHPDPSTLRQPPIDLAPLGRRASALLGPSACSITISSEADIQPPMTPVTSTTTNTAANTADTIRNPASQRMRRRAAYEANSAAWSYAKCALLFFTALLVTWIPSSANRVFSVVHVDQVSVPLEYMSAFVLPLQGFWNAIIYAVTSWKAVCAQWDDIIGSCGSRQSHHQRDIVPHRQISSRRKADRIESDSIKGLAGVRSVSMDSK